MICTRCTVPYVPRRRSRYGAVRPGVLARLAYGWRRQVVTLSLLLLLLPLLLISCPPVIPHYI